MVTCPQCGLVQPDGAAFCDECGTSLSAPAPSQPAYAAPQQSYAPPQSYSPPPQSYGGATVMAAACPTCGSPILPGTQFCDNCGASLAGGGAHDAGFAAGPVAPAAGFPPPAAAVPAAAAAGAASGSAQACPSCGARLEPGSAFCDMCGAKVSSVQPFPISSETQVQSGGMPGGAGTPFDAFGGGASSWDAGGGAADNWGAPPPVAPYGGASYQDQTIVSGPQGGAPSGDPGYGAPSSGPAPYGGAGPADATYVAGPSGVKTYGGQDYGGAPASAPYSPPPAAYDPGVGACPQGRLVVQTNNATILFPPGKPKLLIGREDPVSGVFPDIDMTNYGGDEGGVSRSHAQIYVQAGQVVIEDLQSVNLTYVNREKLTPYQPHPLNDGDTVRLGRIKLNYYR